MSNINFVIRMQRWMDSVPGQTFLNYAYSWGAAIVILGALFKLTHLPGGNFMLFIGMGTEVIVFFLSAFDRPFNKEEINKEIPRHIETDEQIAASLGMNQEEGEYQPEYQSEYAPAETSSEAYAPAETAQPAAQPAAAAGGVYVVSAPAAAAAPESTPADPVAESVPDAAPAASQPAAAAAEPQSATAAAQAAIAALTPAGAQPFEAEAQRLAEIIRAANDELLRRAQAVLSPEMEEATQQYIQKLQTLAETFQKVDEQSVRLTRDSEEMANLNRTLTAINKTYDLHFQSISKQVGTIENINEQTRLLAKQIEDLNGVFCRMIQALTVSMSVNPAAAPAAGMPGAAPTTPGTL